MGYPATVIPEKIFFKIGEVCDLVGVQAHVLRYWETEFPTLSPQKNRSGQRTYRRRDVEIALRIKELLYDELFTIAGAKKKLQSELREATKLKIVHSEPAQREQREAFLQPVSAPEPENAQEFEDEEIYADDEAGETVENYSHGYQPAPQISGEERREALMSLASQLLELSEMVRKSKADDESFRLRKY